MLRLIGRRLGFGVVILFAVSIVVFGATSVLPGNVAQALAPRDQERQKLLVQQYGLDKPVLEQYWNWLVDLLSFDLGDSYVHERPVTEIVGGGIVNSLMLMLVAAAIATPIAVLAGTWSAYRRDRTFDTTTTWVSLVLAALPEFVIGIGLIVTFATGGLGLFRAVASEDVAGTAWRDPRNLVLPTATLVLMVMPPIIRMMRAMMIEVLESEYVQQARLKGLPERTVMFRHALPNALGPVAQVVALQMAWLAGGVVVVEAVFDYRGVGYALINAVETRDLPIIQVLCLLIAGVYIVVNLLADVVSLAANPRVRTART